MFTLILKGELYRVCKQLLRADELQKRLATVYRAEPDISFL
jgi:hypothetical protein